MNIFDLFKSAPANPPAPQNNSGAPQNQPPGAQGTSGTPLPGTQAGAGTAPNGVVPAQKTDPNAGGNTGNSDGESPLAKHADIWKIPDNAGTQQPTPLFANLDPQKVMESAKKVNFAQAVTPETLKKIQEGGEGAVAALVESLNSVAQTVYAQSAVATTKIVEQALGKAQEQYDARIPGMLKKLTAGETLIQENPLFSNPAIQPIVGALQEVLVQKNPQASSREIAEQITDYLKQLGTAVSPAPATPQPKGKSKEQDWSNFLE